MSAKKLLVGVAAMVSLTLFVGTTVAQWGGALNEPQAPDA